LGRVITVLHIITGLGSGGAERMLTRVVTTTSDHRHVVISLMDGGFFGQSLASAGIEYHCLNLRHFWRVPIIFPCLVALIRRLRPDVVMTWLYHADFLGTLAALIGGVSARRIVWNVRCSDINFGDYARTTRWLTRFLAFLSSRPGAITHNSHAGLRAHEALGYRPRRWVYTPNGFDVDEWSPNEDDRTRVREEWGVTAAEIVVGIIARYSPQKDFSTLFEAARQLVEDHSKVRFIVIGRGTESLAIPYSLSSVFVILGERADVSRLVRGFDIAVLSSAYGEGFPNALGEAMASSVPCVSTDVGDAAVVIGDTGRIVPVGRPDRLAQAISDMIVLGPTARAELGTAARRRIVERWSMARTLSHYTDLWTDIAVL